MDIDGKNEKIYDISQRQAQLGKLDNFDKNLQRRDVITV